MSSVAFCLIAAAFQGMSVHPPLFTQHVTEWDSPVSNADDCQAFIRAIGALCIPALTFNSLLILIRARAVYGHSWRMTSLLFLSWCTAVGTSFVAPFALTAVVHAHFLSNTALLTGLCQHIGPTRRCVGNRVSPHLAIPIIMNAANGTFVFFAISYRIVSLSMRGDTWGARARTFFRGDGLPAVAKDLLHGGQLCYLCVAAISKAWLANDIPQSQA